MNSQEPEIVLSPCNPGTSSCKVNWYGQSIWFQSLGKLVPWREPSPSSLCRTKTDDRPKKLSQKRMYKQTGINPQANTAVSEAGVASIGFSVFFSSLSSFLFNALTSQLLPLTLPAPLHFFPTISLTPFRASVTIPSVALGIYLILVGSQGDGCERVSTEEEEEEEVVRACQAVNKTMRDWSEFCCHGLP